MDVPLEGSELFRNAEAFKNVVRQPPRIAEKGALASGLR
jgi:hypothetical protein